MTSHPQNNWSLADMATLGVSTVDPQTPSSQPPEPVEDVGMVFGDLPDDILGATCRWVAGMHDILNLVNLSLVNKRLHGLATDNKSWYHAYRRRWPKLASFAPYRVEALPPPNWKRRYIASHVALRGWANYGKQLADGKPLEVDSSLDLSDLVTAAYAQEGPSDGVAPVDGSLAGAPATQSNEPATDGPLDHTSITDASVVVVNDTIGETLTLADGDPDGPAVISMDPRRHGYVPPLLPDIETIEQKLGHSVWEYLVSKKDCENMLFSVPDIVNSAFYRDNKAAADMKGWSTVLSDLCPDRAFELSDGPINVIGIRLLVTAPQPLDPQDLDLEEDTILEAILFIDMETQSVLPQSTWHCTHAFQVHLKYVDVETNVFAVVRAADAGSTWAVVVFYKLRDRD
ncbi:hypothetical protein HK097_010752, partial [Rhizophlyctis rosea]